MYFEQVLLPCTGIFQGQIWGQYLAPVLSKMATEIPKWFNKFPNV